MRRLVPWVLVSLVALGAAAGAALGIAHTTAPETPSQWVAAVLATTERADTARFSYANVTSSPNADLRGSLVGPRRGQLRHWRRGGHRGRSSSQFQLRRQPAAAPGALLQHGEGHCHRRNRLPSQPRFRGSASPPCTTCFRSRSCHARQRGLSLALNADRGPRLLARAECRGVRAQPRSGQHRRRGHHAVRGHVCAPPRLCPPPAACSRDRTSELTSGSTAPGGSSRCAARPTSAATCPAARSFPPRSVPFPSPRRRRSPRSHSRPSGPRSTWSHPRRVRSLRVASHQSALVIARSPGCRS